MCILLFSSQISFLLTLSQIYRSLFAGVSHPYNKQGNAKVLHILSPVYFWTSEGYKVLLIISIIWRNFYILTIISFSFWYEKEQAT